MDSLAEAYLAREWYEERLRKAAQTRKVLSARSVQKLPLLLRVILLTLFV
jgi:hypothetical protein